MSGTLAASGIPRDGSDPEVERKARCHLAIYAYSQLRGPPADVDVQDGTDDRGQRHPPDP